MNLPKFKVGDILTPIKKGISNYYLLKDLLEVEVIRNDLNSAYSKKMIEIKIIKGFTNNYNNYTCKSKFENLQVFEDAFRLLNSTEEDYSLF
jgi:hypothetical protein